MMTLTNHHGKSDQSAAATAAGEDEELAAAASMVDVYRHIHVVRRVERLIEAMLHPDTGVPFKAQKAFLSTVPAAVSGNDLITWLRERTEAAEPGEAAHIAAMLAVYGYVYPLADGHSLQVKAEPASLYRFQSPYYWLSISGRADNVDYAIFLTKRMIRSKQKTGFEDYEKSALARLQKLLADRWQFIALQAEEELKLSRERKRNDRMVLDMQEQAYWRVHRPPPGYMNPVDHPLARYFSADQIQRRMAKGREKQLRQHDSHMQCRRQQQQQEQQEAVAAAAAAAAAAGLGQSGSGHKSVDTIVMSYELTRAFDWFLPAAGDAENSEEQNAGVPSGSPWLLDDPGAFQSSQGTGESGLTPKQVKLWGTSFDFLLRDATGREYFRHFLTKEFSSENLRFWLAVQDCKFGPASQLHARMDSIFSEFLASGAPSEINIDSRTMTATQRGMQSPGRFSFEEAQGHIYLLMKKDSYQRFLRSEDYRSLLQASADRHAKKGGAFNVARRQVSSGAFGTTRNRPETTSSVETSGSGSSRPVRSNPAVVVQLQRQQQPVSTPPGGVGDGAGPSRRFFAGGSADEVTPWEAGENWEASGNSENPVTPWETSGNPGNPVTPWEAPGNPENLVTPWETDPGPASPGNPAENPASPRDAAGNPGNPGPSNASENPVAPWETLEKPENVVTPWE